ncbi:MAG: imidazole glycerol phosphate synthase subunit HisF [Halobacteriota archaeon]|jgi:cyclase
MLTKRIIPCLDVKYGDGNRALVVKGIEFVSLREAGDPVELAKRYDQEGADELIFLDITASHEHRKTMLDIVKDTADQVFIPFCVGGGVRTLNDVIETLRSGADKIAINTAAVKNPHFITHAAETVGSQCIVLAIDCRRNTDVEKGQHLVPLEDGTLAWYEVVIYGGRTPTGIDAIEWAIQSERLGAGEIMLTSMNRDGTKDGYDIPITKAISEAIDLPIIASGGAGTAEHIYDGFVYGKADACLAASIFHFKEISIASLKQYLQARGILMRI